MPKISIPIAIPVFISIQPKKLPTTSPNGLKIKDVSILHIPTVANNITSIATKKADTFDFTVCCIYSIDYESKRFSIFKYVIYPFATYLLFVVFNGLKTIVELLEYIQLSLTFVSAVAVSLYILKQIWETEPELS